MNLAGHHPGLHLTTVTSAEMRQFLAHEADRGLAPKTLSTYRVFYDYLVEEGRIEASPMARVTVKIKLHNHTTCYAEAEADQIPAWTAAQPGPRWAVGYPLLATARYTGIRLAELANLRLDQVDLDAKRITIVGKGDKQRMVAIPPALAPILGRYLDEVRPALRRSPSFFVNPHSAKHHQFRASFGPRSILTLVKAAGTGAGVASQHHTHRWRHTYAPASCAGGWTSTRPSASWATRTSPPRPGTCTW